MKQTFIFILFLLLSCTKEDQCRNRFLVTESNEDEASNKCQGLANNYPNFKIISRVLIGCLNAEELTQAKRTTSAITKTMCSNITFTVRTRIE